MEELISKKKLLAAQGDPFLANIIHRAIQCVENQRVVVIGLDLAKEDSDGASL